MNENNPCKSPNDFPTGVPVIYGKIVAKILKILIYFSFIIYQLYTID